CSASPRSSQRAQPERAHGRTVRCFVRPQRGKKQIVRVDELHDCRRMRVNNHLSEWVVFTYRELWINRQVLGETHHGRDVRRMDTVLRLLYADDPGGRGVFEQHTER